MFVGMPREGSAQNAGSTHAFDLSLKIDTGTKRRGRRPFLMGQDVLAGDPVTGRQGQQQNAQTIELLLGRALTLEVAQAEHSDVAFVVIHPAGRQELALGDGTSDDRFA